MNTAEKSVFVCVPAYSHSQRLGGAGTRADDLRLQTFRLEDVEEGVTRRDRPWETIKRFLRKQRRLIATFNDYFFISKLLETNQ